MGFVKSQKWVPLALTGLLGLCVIAAAGLGIAGGVAIHNPATKFSVVRARHPRSPYQDVSWPKVSYPGLDCQYIASGNVRRPGSIVIEDVAVVRVTGRTTPLALVIAGCNLNHLYVNLFAFTIGTDRSRPILLQQLGLYQGSETLTEFQTSTDHVSMKLAGYTPDEALCCPSIISLRRWIWNGNAFVPSRVVTVTKIAMPDIVGMTFGRADRELGNLGIIFFNDTNEGPTNGGSIITTQSPRPGAVLHPPAFQVSVTTRRRW